MGRLALILLLVFVGLCPARVDAACTGSSPTWTTTADYASVSSCVSGATAGDTINISAGSATWSSTLTLTKAVSLIGATCTLDGGGRPTSCPVDITVSATTGIAIDPTTPSGNPVIRVAHLSLNGGTQVVQWANSSTTVALSNVRLDHSILKNGTSGGLQITDDVWGLADHNWFDNNYVHVRCFGNESTSWTNFPAAPGTATKPFIEDSRFTQSSSASFAFITECGQGGRLVLRHCDIDISFTTGGFWEVFDYHGNQTPYPDSRGTVEFETYNNTITLTNVIDRLNVRGGTGKIFNNTITQAGGGNTISFELTEYDNTASCGSHYGLLTDPPGYDPIADLFFFNNLRNGTYKAPQLVCDDVDPALDDRDFIRLNQEYFEPPYGLASARPGSCTANTYYGATDTGVISKCVSTDVWNTYYTPYTYPHPLQVGGGGGVGSGHGKGRMRMRGKVSAATENPQGRADDKQREHRGLRHADSGLQVRSGRASQTGDATTQRRTVRQPDRDRRDAQAGEIGRSQQRQGVDVGEPLTARVDKGEIQRSEAGPARSQPAEHGDAIVAALPRHIIKERDRVQVIRIDGERRAVNINRKTEERLEIFRAQPWAQVEQPHAFRIVEGKATTEHSPVIQRAGERPCDRGRLGGRRGQQDSKGQDRQPHLPPPLNRDRGAYRIVIAEVNSVPLV